MKRTLKLLLAISVVMAMGITSIAAPSVSSKYEFNSATDKNGERVELTIAAPTKTLSASEAIKLLNLDVDAKDIAVLLHDITAPEGTVFPLTITLDVTGVTSSSNVYILQYTNGTWKYIPVKAGVGTITFTADSLSTFAVIQEGAAITSPKTGEGSMSTILIIGILAITAAVITSKRKIA